MPTPPADLPREPYRALAAFFVLPLVAAAVGAWRTPADAPAAPAAGYVGASLGNPPAGAGLHPVRPPAPRRGPPPEPATR